MMTKRLSTKQYRGVWPDEVILRGQPLSVREHYRIVAMTDEERLREYGLHLTDSILARVKAAVEWWQRYDAQCGNKKAR
jgi:hypothetical protein